MQLSPKFPSPVSFPTTTCHLLLGGSQEPQTQALLPELDHGCPHPSPLWAPLKPNLMIDLLCHLLSSKLSAPSSCTAPSPCTLWPCHRAFAQCSLFLRSAHPTSPLRSDSPSSPQFCTLTHSSRPTSRTQLHTRFRACLSKAPPPLHTLPPLNSGSAGITSDRERTQHPVLCPAQSGRSKHLGGEDVPPPPPPACRPDLVGGRLFGVRLFLLFLILFLILTVGRSKSIRAPLQTLLTQRLLRLQAGLLKARLLPIAQAWAAVRAGGPCRGQGHRRSGVRAHTDTQEPGGVVPSV